MYYDLELFGKKVCSIRNALELTQKDVSDLTYINIDTLRKIENGKVTPKQDTLEILSSVLKTDLNNELLKYRLSNYTEFNKIKNRIEYNIENGIYDKLQEDVDNINNVLNEISVESYITNNIKQLTLLVQAIILKVKHQEYNKSLKKLVDAIRISTPTFDLFNYDTFIYNSMEVRILMNIALNINVVHSKKKGLEILEFCLSAIEPDDYEFRIKILYNLAYNYHRLDLNEKTLYYAEEGIKTCISNNSLSCLGLLYSRKGIAEYFLGYDNYMNTLKKAITIYEITNQIRLKEMLLNVCKDYNIELLNS